MTSAATVKHAQRRLPFLESLAKSGLLTGPQSLELQRMRQYSGMRHRRDTGSQQRRRQKRYG